MPDVLSLMPVDVVCFELNPQLMPGFLVNPQLMPGVFSLIPSWRLVLWVNPQLMPGVLSLIPVDAGCFELNPSWRCVLSSALLFSATFKRRVERVCRDILTDPVRVIQGDVGEVGGSTSMLITFSSVSNLVGHLICHKGSIYFLLYKYGKHGY